ncbi:UNVERIFIED_CONTAM: hypothetical protein Sangu_2138300 [Sesamum angustifolium]|uniref:Uncharacterized protein n=1 Tax=Sesamum angustifolium TaxID=2727405 RepID=A0AAW2LDN4_9LAMI
MGEEHSTGNKSAFDDEKSPIAQFALLGDVPLRFSESGGHDSSTYGYLGLGSTWAEK